jgi:hypothetical protein
MKRTFDPSAARDLLRRGILKGYWTLEDLDKPAPGTELNFAEYRRFLALQKAYVQAPVYKNLLRDDDESPDTALIP